MNSLFNKHRWMQVMWGILLFVAGTITIIFTATSEEGADSVGLVLSICLAVVLFSYGLTILFTSFLEMKDKMFKAELVFGSIILAFAVVFCLKFEKVKDLIVLFAAINLLCFGVVFAVRAILCFTQKIRPVWRVFCIIFATVFIACGVLAIVFENDCLKICYFVIGALLVFTGITETILAIKESIKKAKSQQPIIIKQEAPKAKPTDVKKEEEPKEIEILTPEQIEHKPE